MKFKSKFDWINVGLRVLGTVVALAGICGLFYIYIFAGLESVNLFLIALGIFVLGLLAWRFLLYPLFKTYYLVDEKGVTFVQGRDEILVEYKSILRLEKSTKFLAKFTMANDKLNIVYLDEGVRKSIYATPLKRQEFITELKIHSHSMKIDL